MNPLDNLRSWFLAAAGAAVLAAVAFVAADPAESFVVIIGFLLAAAGAGVGAWALISLNRLECPQCGEQFAHVIATLDRPMPDGGWSDHCAHCGFVYERRDWTWRPPSHG